MQLNNKVSILAYTEEEEKNNTGEMFTALFWCALFTFFIKSGFQTQGYLVELFIWYYNSDLICFTLTDELCK